MKEIEVITYKFFPAAETLGRKTHGTNAIASEWTVYLKDYKTTKKKYNITLLDNNIDSSYSSLGSEIKKYYIQIDDLQKEIKRSCPICPKIEKGRPIYYYQVSEKDFVEFDLQNFIKENSNSIEKIVDENLKSIKYLWQDKQEDKSSKIDDLKKRIKNLDLNEYESKALFLNVFQKYLTDSLKKEDSSINIKDFSNTENSPLLNDISEENSIKSFFCKIFCCYD